MGVRRAQRGADHLRLGAFRRGAALARHLRRQQRRHPWVGHKPSEVSAWCTRARGPALIVNHPAVAASGPTSLGRLRQRARRRHDTELWSDDFDAVEVFNDSDFEPTVTTRWATGSPSEPRPRHLAVGSSDSHHLRSSPAGYPRTCLWMGHDDPTLLSPSIVRDGILSGNSTISGGLYMMVRGPNGEMPGGAVRAGGGEVTFTVTVRAPSWIAADSLETIVNGESVSTDPLLPLGDGTGKTFVNEVTLSEVPGARRTWVVFHAKGETDLKPLHPGRRPFAASNPIFIQ